jgi:hypothetical protein
VVMEGGSRSRQIGSKLDTVSRAQGTSYQVGDPGSLANMQDAAVIPV